MRTFAPSGHPPPALRLLPCCLGPRHGANLVSDLLCSRRCRDGLAAVQAGCRLALRPFFLASRRPLPLSLTLTLTIGARGCRGKRELRLIHVGLDCPRCPSTSFAAALIVMAWQAMDSRRKRPTTCRVMPSAHPAPCRSAGRRAVGSGRHHSCDHRGGHLYQRNRAGLLSLARSPSPSSL